MPFEGVRTMATGALENAKEMMEKSKEKTDEVKRIVRADQKGWLVCLAVLIVTVVRSGITYSFGSVVVNLKDLFPDVTLTEQNYIGTLSFCISLSCAPLSVSLIRSFGHRGFRIGGLVGTAILTISCLGSSFAVSPAWLFLTHSLLYGVGSSLIYMASSLVIGDYFRKDHKYHVLATSILLCGYPIGSLLFNPINAWLIYSYDFRTAFRCSAGIIFVCGIGCCWNFSARETEGMTRLDDGGNTVREADSFDDEERSSLAGESTGGPDEEPSSMRKCCTWAEISRRPEIVLWYIGNCLSYLGFYMPFVNLEYYMKLKEIPMMKSSMALTLLSLAECVTYIIASFLGDYLKDRLVYVNVISSSCLALICIVWPFIDVTYILILVIAIGMGGFLGLNIVYTYAASGEVTRLPIDVAWSCTNLWSGIGILLGPFFSGKVYDVTGTYTAVFLTVGGVYVLATLAFGAIPLIQRRRERLYGDPSMDEMNGATRFETFRISTKRSTSKSSLHQISAAATVGAGAGAVPGATPIVNGLFEASQGHGTVGDSGPSQVSAYGTIVAGPQAGMQQVLGGSKPPVPYDLRDRSGRSAALNNQSPPYHSTGYDYK